MIYSYAEEVQRVAERTADNKQAIAQMNKQRRNSVVDMFGVPFTSYGGGSVPATVYLSVSPDLIQYSRFQLKVSIEPFRSTAGGVDVQPTSLSASGTTEGSISSTSDGQGLVELEVDVDGTMGAITPNPHDHNVTVTGGVSEIHTTATDFRLLIDGVDITAYLQAQHGGAWISGEGIFPTNTIEDTIDFYDILDVAGLLYAEGKTTEHDKLLKPGFKPITITSASPFQATVFLYVKYNYTGR